MSFPFLKMQGAGNDFVIVDARKIPVGFTPAQIRQIADRANAVTKGCDQVIVMESSQKADVFMRIYNADGGEVDACGNATRCVGWLIHKKTGKKEVCVETKAGLLRCGVAANDSSVAWANMGAPRLEWQEIPLAEERDTLHLHIGEGVLQDPVAVSMGNPHAVFFVADVEAVDLATLGPKLEHHPLFPERANIGVARIHAQGDIALRVWERGAGETLSCGTGACAALVAAHRRGLAGRKAAIRTKGGLLGVEWLENGDVLFQGMVQKEFEGTLTL